MFRALTDCCAQRRDVAAARDEVSLGVEKYGHGLFTQAIVEGLIGVADTNPKDGNITFAELRDFVVKRVTELTGGRQHPQLPFLDHFEPDAVLARAVYAR